MENLKSYDGFFNLFERINFHPGDEPSFPLDFPTPEIKRSPACLWSGKLDAPEMFYPDEEQEYLHIYQNILKDDDNFTIQQQLNIQALKVVLAAAVERNMIIYDSVDNDKTKPTLKLQALLNQTHRRNGGIGKIGKIFLNENNFPEENRRLELINDWYLVPSDIWQEVENYYLNDLEGSFAPNTNNLLIGISDKSYYTCVHPVFNETNDGIKCGLGILDIKTVILGSY